MALSLFCILASPGLFALSDNVLLDALTGKLYGAGVTFQQLTEAFMSDPLKFPALLKA